MFIPPHSFGIVYIFTSSVSSFSARTVMKCCSDPWVVFFFFFSFFIFCFCFWIRRVLFGPDNPYFRVNAVVVREVSLPSSIIALVITTRLFAAFTRTAITPNATLLMPWLTLWAFASDIRDILLRYVLIDTCCRVFLCLSLVSDSNRCGILGKFSPCCVLLVCPVHLCWHRFCGCN